MDNLYRAKEMYYIDMTNGDLELLRNSKHILENPGFSSNIINIIGKPINIALDNLPGEVKEKINKIAKHSTLKALKYAMYSLKKQSNSRPRNFEHKAAAALSGAAGGFFGLSSLAIELPVSTMIILRSIADIARSEGEDLRIPEAALQCLEVFALGENSGGTRKQRIGYYGIRAILANEIAGASAHIASKGLSLKNAPAFINLVNIISARFGITISEKVAAQALPVIGAVGGGMINALFMEHFQNLAKGHFSIRRLERKYGTDSVKRSYLSI